MLNNIYDLYDIHNESFGETTISNLYYGKLKKNGMNVIIKSTNINKFNICKNTLINDLKILINLKHSNLLKIYEYYILNDYIYIVLERCQYNLLTYFDQSTYINADNILFDVI